MSDEAAKVKDLCEIVVHRADAECEKIISRARDETEEWARVHKEETQKKIASIISDAKKQSEGTHSRRVTEAKIDAERERLKLLSDCVEKARAIFMSKLEAFPNRADYPEILAGLVAAAAEKLPRGQKLIFKLRADDAKWGEPVEAVAKIKFDSTPADIDGGAELSSEDGRWRVVSDWKAKTEEMADAIAKRVLAAL